MKRESRSLASLAIGETAKIFATPTHNERLAEIGLVKGESVTLLKEAPLGDPVILKILDAEIVVRRAELQQVLVF